MAERRMFAKTIIDSDAFIDMPMSARLLYYDLSMRADDEGFVNAPKKIMRMVGATDDDMRILIAKKFVIDFETGVVVIKHWRIHNYIQNDRFKETNYKDEKSLLELDENKAYRMVGNNLDTKCIQSGYNLDTQDRLGKDSIGKVSLVEDSIEQPKGWKYFESPKLEQAFKDFVEMRKKKRKPLSDRALKMAMNELVKHSTINGVVDEDLMFKVIEQSIYHCWDSFYELKEYRNSKQTNKFEIDWSNL